MKGNEGVEKVEEIEGETYKGNNALDGTKEYATNECSISVSCTNASVHHYSISLYHRLKLCVLCIHLHACMRTSGGSCVGVCRSLHTDIYVRVTGTLFLIPKFVSFHRSLLW